MISAWFRFTVLIVLTAANPLVAINRVLAQDAGVPKPLPSDSAQAEAMKLVKEVYGDEYKSAKTVAQKTGLAEKLLQKASESKADPAAHYVLLKLARDIAVQAGEADLALRAVEDTASAYQVDVFAMKLETIIKAAKSATLSKQYPVIVEQAKALLDESIGKDDFDSATQLAETAITAAKNSKDLALAKQMVNRSKEVAEIGKAYEEAKEAFATLEKKPVDPDANLAVGKYLCFFKRNWDKGLPKLALGSELPLKSLAVKELEGTTDTNAQVALGDSWWGLADKEEGLAKKQIQGRAAYWYRRAFPGLAGLVKDKVEKRLLGVTSASNESGVVQRVFQPRVLLNSIGMKFARIPAGEFMMGSSSADIAQSVKKARQKTKEELEGEPPEEYVKRILSEGPRHRVVITKPFYMGMYPVTQAEYQQVMGTNPSVFSTNGPKWAKARIGDGEIDTARFPVETIKWIDAQEYCLRLSAFPAEVAAGRQYRLPAEAEWEYACRAGTSARYCFGNLETDLDQYAWYSKDSGKKPHPVGEKRPNRWELYDMHGNVWEWCSDWYDKEYYGKSLLADPTGPTTGSRRVVRGGSYFFSALDARCAARTGSPPEAKSFGDFGFRVVCVPKGVN